MSFVSHPAGLPDLFLDRSLGRIQVPKRLRATGLRLTTLAERYGVGPDQFIADVEWLADAGQRGEAVFMKDSRIHVNQLEWDMVTQFGVRCFCLANRHLSAGDMATWFLNNLVHITEACRSLPGPFMYIVYADRIRRLDRN